MVKYVTIGMIFSTRSLLFWKNFCMAKFLACFHLGIQIYIAVFCLEYKTVLMTLQDRFICFKLEKQGVNLSVIAAFH